MFLNITLPASREIKSLDERIRTMTMELSASNEKYQKLGITAASKRTELNVAEVKGQVLDQTLKMTEEELNRGLKETVRTKLLVYIMILYILT